MSCGGMPLIGCKHPRQLGLDSHHYHRQSCLLMKKGLLTTTQIPVVPPLALAQSSSHLSYDWNVSPHGFVVLSTNVAMGNKSGKHLSTWRLQNYWISFAQNQAFVAEIEALKNKESVSKSSTHFIHFSTRLVCCELVVGVVIMLKCRTHRFILWYLQSEHRRLMHTGPTFLTASLNHRYHLVVAEGSSVVASLVDDLQPDQ